MASNLRFKIKQFPSGLTSAVLSHVPVGNGSRCGSGHCSPSFPFPDFETGEMRTKDSVSSEWDYLGNRAKVRQIEATPEKAGHGGLGNKQKASWKSLRNARERMASIEMEYGKKNCGFLTVTLPSESPRAYEALARYSSYAMDRLNRYLNRYFDSSEMARVSVWEYQERGALHCHILIASERIHAIKKEEFIAYIQKAWYSILESIGKKFDADMFLNSKGKIWSLDELKMLKNKKDEGIFVNFQIVKKSIVAYLSRYLADSNHEKNCKNKQSLREKFFPIATWLQWNRTATKCYEKHMEEFDLGVAEVDKKTLFIKMIGSLKKDIYKKIPLARGTELKSPKNPYNEGLYFIPANPMSERLSELLASFIGRIGVFLKQERDGEELKVEHIPLKALEESQWLDFVENYKRKKARKPYDNFNISMLDLGKNLANIALCTLDLGQAFIDRFKPKEHIQMRLDYGLEA